MLYLEDFLELIEHLPQELRDRFTDIRERDLQVHNSSEQLKEKVKHFFASAKKSKPEQRECELQNLLDGYKETEKYADDKVHIADQIHKIMTKLVQRLDTELERFKLELEADHAGITEELEKRSLELDSDTRFDDLINNHLSASSLNNSSHSTAKVNFLNNKINQAKQPAGIKDRRRSEHKQHRHHPYHNDHTNGYHHQQQQGRGKISNQEHDHLDSLARNNQRQLVGKSNGQCRSQNLTNTPYYHPLSQSYSSSSAPASVAGDLNGIEQLGHYGIYNPHPSANDSNSKCQSNKQQISNLPLRHSSLEAALAHQQHLNLSSLNGIANQNKISGKALKDADRIEIIGQNPLAAAASQAIAATQQLQLGRRTPSLKASFAAINTGGPNPLETLPGNKQDALSGTNRNALAPMAPDQQGFRYSHFGKTNGRPKAGPNPLFNSNNLSVTKSGRPTKRPRHHASHLYPDESPASNSSDNSVFENSESVSSADFIETGTTFGSSSPASLDFAANNTAQGNTTLYHRDETKYCICRQISYGEMVACDNVGCEIEWFHYDCVGITQPPKGKWFCPDCTRARHLGTTAIKSSKHFKETSNV